jgi:hypothetical protein
MNDLGVVTKFCRACGTNSWIHIGPMANEREPRNCYQLRRWKNDQFIGKWDVANLRMQFVSIGVNPKISCASDNSENVNVVEVESIGWEALNWMKMDENLHASFNQTASWWAKKESGAQWHLRWPPHVTHGYFSLMPWLGCRRIRVSTVWGPQEHVSPKTGQKLLGFVKP